ncbi:MAG: hypothetical protein Q9170_001496 [Blastenia crenularia]
MSLSKPSSDIPRGTFDELPPPYSKSLSTSQPPNPIKDPVNVIVSTRILTRLNNPSATTLVLVTSNVSPLSVPLPTTSSNSIASPPAFPGEQLVGFPSYDTPILIRLSNEEKGLDFWRGRAVLRELAEHLRGELVGLGYKVVESAPPLDGPEWRFLEQLAVGKGEARRLWVAEVLLGHGMVGGDTLNKIYSSFSKYLHP